MRAIVSAGGTGGHIFPALAVINKIKKMEPNSEILYIGTTDRMESEIIPKKGIEYIGIEMKGLNRRNLLKNFKVIASLNKAYRKCQKIIKEFDPDIVIGIGGYITFPVVSAAHSLGYKTFIHEQNSIPGLSNKILKHKATAIGVSLESSLHYFDKDKTYFTGNPRSEEVVQIKPASKSKYGLQNNKKLVLIVMGSLGSLTISNKMKEILPKFKDKEYEIMFVTGKGYYEVYKNLKNIPSNVKIVEFLDDMLGLLKKTDLIVSRAGASIIAEITALELPSILIPSPYVTHNHQYKNAKVLENVGASVLIEEEKLDADTLINSVDSILNDKKRYSEMKSASAKLAIKDSATKIYQLLQKTIDGDANE